MGGEGAGASLLGTFWPFPWLASLLEALWGDVSMIWGPLRELLGFSWGVCWGSWRSYFEVSWVLLGPLEALLGIFWMPLGEIVTILGISWVFFSEPLGLLLESFGELLEGHWVLLRPAWGILCGLDGASSSMLRHLRGYFLESLAGPRGIWKRVWGSDIGPFGKLFVVLRAGFDQHSAPRLGGEKARSRTS